MGKYFNEVIRDMPSSEVKKQMNATKTPINPIYGQTKGWAEESRKAFNEANDTQATTLVEEKPIDLLRKTRADNLIKAREAKRLKKLGKSNISA